MAESFTYAVFLSHNSKDKLAVRELKRLLVANGLAVWLDEDELQPGIPWQQLLESGIKASASAVVLVGNDGLGPWEDEEMQAALRLAVKDKRPVIPVLLPGAPAQPKLPLFLTNRTWVDLRAGFDNGGLEKLVWGITGQKPQQIQNPVTPPVQSPGPTVASPSPLRHGAAQVSGRNAERNILDDESPAGRRRENSASAGASERRTDASTRGRGTRTGPPKLPAKTALGVFGVLLAAVLFFALAIASGALRFGLEAPVVYTLYVIAGLLAATLCFRILGSAGGLHGQPYGMTLRLGGAVVGLVVVAGGGALYERHVRTPAVFNFRVTFSPEDHDPPGPANGDAVISFGDQQLIASLDGVGSTLFQGLAAHRRGVVARLTLRSRDYELPTGWREVTLTDQEPVLVHVRRKATSPPPEDPNRAPVRPPTDPNRTPPDSPPDPNKAPPRPPTDPNQAPPEPPPDPCQALPRIDEREPLRSKTPESTETVERQGAYIVITVSASGDTVLHLLQNARDKACEAFATYALETLKLTGPKEELRRFALEHEDVVEGATNPGNNVRFVFKYPVPQRENGHGPK